MYYLKQFILLLSFGVLIYQIAYLSSYKNEMEVTYESKQNDTLPAISICTFTEYLQKNCDELGFKTNGSTKIKCEMGHCEHNPSSFLNKTTRELFEFERRCSFLDQRHLNYCHNNTFHIASKVTPYLNFGLFCKLYEFDNPENHNEGFFKVNSTDNEKHRIVVFMHERGCYPTDLNLKVSWFILYGPFQLIVILFQDLL